MRVRQINQLNKHQNSLLRNPLLPLQPRLFGQAASSMLTFWPARITNPANTSRIDLPVPPGTRQDFEQQKSVLQRKPCWTHEIAHTAFLLSSTTPFRMSTVFLRYCSITSISVELHFSREAGKLLSGQVSLRIARIPQRSYSDWMTNRAGLRYLITSEVVQTSCSLRHSSQGGVVSVLIIWLMYLNSSTPGVELVKGLQKSDTKMPLSQIISTLSLFSARLQTQLPQATAAIAPAEVPVMTIWEALKKLYLVLRQLNWAIVLLAPLKYKLEPLQEIGESLEPWCREPSQQGTYTLVHEAQRGFAFSSFDRTEKSSKSMVGLRLFELPRLVLERLRQSQMVSCRVIPWHMPPPSKQTKI